jgi:hypothetical protein
LKRLIPRNSRRKERLRPYLFEQVWSLRNKTKLWNALLKAFRTEMYADDNPHDDAFEEEVVYEGELTQLSPQISKPFFTERQTGFRIYHR